MLLFIDVHNLRETSQADSDAACGFDTGHRSTGTNIATYVRFRFGGMSDDRGTDGVVVTCSLTRV